MQGNTTKGDKLLIISDLGFQEGYGPTLPGRKCKYNVVSQFNHTGLLAWLDAVPWFLPPRNFSQ